MLIEVEPVRAALAAVHLADRRSGGGERLVLIPPPGGAFRAEGGRTRAGAGGLDEVLLGLAEEDDACRGRGGEDGLTAQEQRPASFLSARDLQRVVEGGDRDEGIRRGQGGPGLGHRWSTKRRSTMARARSLLAAAQRL